MLAHPYLAHFRSELRNSYPMDQANDGHSVSPTTRPPLLPPRPRTFTYVETHSVAFRSDLVEDPDVQILDIFQPGQPTIINVYNDAPSKRNSIMNPPP